MKTYDSVVCAGLMLFSYWEDVDWNKMVDVNIERYLNGISAVQSQMMRQKSGHIMNMASVAGHQVDARYSVLFSCDG